MAVHRSPLWIVILLIILIPLILYLFNLNIYTFDEGFHQKEFSKYSVQEKLSGENIRELNQNVLDFFKGKKELPDFFNAREKEHLLDVKNLVNLAAKLLIGLVVLFIILLFFLSFFLRASFKTMKYLSIIFIVGSGLTIFLTLFFWQNLKSNFLGFFTSFHDALFDPGTWAFNPDFEKMVVLYPQEFFQDIGVKIATNTLWMAAALLVAGIVLWVLFKKKRV